MWQTATQLRVCEADEAVLFVAPPPASTGVSGHQASTGEILLPPIARTLAAVAGHVLDDLLAAHAADHQALFNRVSLDLGAS